MLSVTSVPNTMIRSRVPSLSCTRMIEPRIFLGSILLPVTSILPKYALPPMRMASHHCASVLPSGETSSGSLLGDAFGLRQTADRPELGFGAQHFGCGAEFGQRLLVVERAVHP